MYVPQSRINSMMRKRKFNRTQRFNPVQNKRQQIQRFGVMQDRVRRGGAAEEKKNIDVVMGAGIIFAQTVADVVPINVPCIEGTSPTTHVGRRIKMKSIFVRWEGSMAPTGTGSSPLRMLIVYDKQSNKLQTAAADVLALDAIESPMNLSNNKRFIILLDEIVQCVGTQGPQAWMIERFRKIDLDVEFNEANGGTFADVNTGLVTAFFYQNSNILIASPIGAFYSRIRFVDA